MKKTAVRSPLRSQPAVRQFRVTTLALALAGAFALMAGSAHAKYDIPTGKAPSPLYGAKPFTQKMLMFEEFGLQPLPTSAPAHSLPDPGGCNGPANPAAYTQALDGFLSEPLFPPPQRVANIDAPNPWAATIGPCLGRAPGTFTGVLEGRPPGENFAHQRWEEGLDCGPNGLSCFPATPAAGALYFQTAMAGARPNGGIRDGLQLHGYQFGEFGPGPDGISGTADDGLYHDTTGGGHKGTTKGITIKFHPLMPVQKPETLWTFDGTLPPKLLMAPYGNTILLRHYNTLPINKGANGGFGANTISTHEHNGHNPAESDGFAGAFFFPGQYFDYRWPMVLAGHDSVPIGSSDPVLAEKNSKAGTPSCADPRPGKCDAPGGVRKIPGDWHETMSTHWFHDHMLDYTAQNVYKGNAAMMNYYSAIDRGNEALDDGTNLRFPSGTALDWGNRDYDVNLVIADKAFDSKGQLWYNTFNDDGFLGDVMTVNFLYKPYFEVRARKYRLRLLNGAVSRYMKIALVDANGKPVPFHMVANDGNIMEHAVKFPNEQAPESLPMQAIAERYDIIVDFSKFKDGDKLYMVNLLEHENGKGVKQTIPLSQVWSGAYSREGCPKTCDPAVGKFLEIRVKAYDGVDLSMNPEDYEEGKKKMVPLPGFTAEELANAKERSFKFGRGNDSKPWTISTDGGLDYTASDHEDMLDRVSAAPDRGSVEIWHLENGGGGWGHPAHIHFEEGQILRRGGKTPPPWEKGARKDLYRIGPDPDSGDVVTVALRVREFLGTYVEHCHNTTHEDNAMLLRWDSQNPGQTTAMQTPHPTWDGVSYYESNTTDVPTYKTGKETDFKDSIAAPVAKNDAATTPAATPVSIPVLANDSCVGGCDPASLTIGSGPSNGSAVRNADGSVTYTPNAGFSGTDNFTYTVRDKATGTSVSSPATVTVTVGQATSLAKPVATADTATTTETTVTGINVTANDSGCESGCTVAIVAGPSHGSVVANSPANGQVTYTPNAGYTGGDSFSYTATNAAGTSNAASVSINVMANPMTDIVTITDAQLRKGELRLKGTVSVQNNAYAPKVEIYAGTKNASATACTGYVIGSASVRSDGRWEFRRTGVTSRDICVKSTNGGVTDRKL